jgi:hypothetical protein
MIAYANTSHKNLFRVETPACPRPSFPLCKATSRLVGLIGPVAGIAIKLKRGTFSVTFFLACIAAMELESIVLGEI